MRVIDRPDMRALTPLGAMDDWKARATDYHLMLEVFRGCIEIKTIPAIGSPCHKKVIELLDGKQTPQQAGEGKI